jgi:hypothetical protein
MRMRSVLLGGLAAMAAFGVAASAQADGLAFNQDLVVPGVYFGTGNANGGFTVDTENGVEVALRAHRYQQPTPTPVGNLYTFSTAATNALTNSLSFDWSVNPSLPGHDTVSLADTTATITITDLLNNHIQSFPANFILLQNATTPGGGYQNSERLVFSFVDSLYDATVNNTFLVNLTLSGLQGGPISVTERIQQGAGFNAVPEPATWAMMILGMGGLGAVMRRRRQAAAIAAA